MSEHGEKSEVKGSGDKSVSDLRLVLQASNLKVSSYFSEAIGWSADATKLLKDFSDLKTAADGISAKLASTLGAEQAALTEEFRTLVQQVEVASKDSVPATPEGRKQRQATIDGIVRRAGTLKTKVQASADTKVKQAADQAAQQKARETQAATAQLKQEFEAAVGTLLDAYPSVMDPNTRANASNARTWFDGTPSENQAANIRAQIARSKQEDWAGLFPANVALVKSMDAAELQAPDLATAGERGKIDTLRTAMAKALATRPVTSATLADARAQAVSIKLESEKSVAANGEARIKERDRLRTLLGEPGHNVPAGATAEQAKPIDAQRGQAVKTLATDPPTQATLKQAAGELKAIETAVGELAKQIAAAALVTRSQSVKDSAGKMRFDKIDPLVGASPEYEADKTALGVALAALATAADEATVKQAEDLVKKLRDRVVDLKQDFDTQLAAYQTALKSYAYLDGKVASMKVEADAKDIRAKLFELRSRLDAALKAAKFGVFGAADEEAIGNDLGAMRALAGRIAAAERSAGAPEATFDWQDSSTWTRRPLRYVGNGVQAYIDGLDAGYQAGLIKQIKDGAAGDRHSHAVLTGVAMHDHTVAGSQGIAFCYNHLGGRDVEPLIYDFAVGRDGNKYNWRHGAKSAGPPAVPGGVAANRRD